LRVLENSVNEEDSLGATIDSNSLEQEGHIVVAASLVKKLEAVW